MKPTFEKELEDEKYVICDCGDNHYHVEKVLTARDKTRKKAEEEIDKMSFKDHMGIKVIVVDNAKEIYRKHFGGEL